MEKYSDESPRRAILGKSSTSLAGPDEAVRHRARWSPRSWTRRTSLIIGIVLVVTITVLGAAVGSTVGAIANAYPKYYKIDYKPQDTYEGPTFFDGFDYFTGWDPTHGFVHYVDAEGARAQNLTHISDEDTAILRVDTSDKNAMTGRRSVRISSKKTYTAGLFIFDIIHSLHGCATWPALWLSDLDTWPAGGEIDVMESVNVGDTGNQMTLHTTGGCKIGKRRSRKQAGEVISNDCYNGTNYNQGCGVRGLVNSYGEAFNANDGGVYALEVRSEGIRIWMFDRDDITFDMWTHHPDPSKWGTPLAVFPNLECDIDSHFNDMKIVANIDLCGDLAGQQSIFGANPSCMGTCADWVAREAVSFEQAYWEFGGFRVYVPRDTSRQGVDGRA